MSDKTIKIVFFIVAVPVIFITVTGIMNIIMVPATASTASLPPEPFLALFFVIVLGVEEMVSN